MKKRKRGIDKQVGILIIIFLLIIAGIFCYKYFFKDESGDEKSGIVSGCGYLSDAVKEEIKNLLSDGKNVILREGEDIHYQEYAVLLNSSGQAFILRLSLVKNQSSGYTSDFCKFTEISSGDTFETVWFSEGGGLLQFGGLEYGITMTGRHTLPSEEYIVRIDYPQTSGRDKLSFEDCMCDFVTNYCVLNMLGNAESIGRISLGVSQRDGQPIEVTSGHDECGFHNKECLLGFGGIVYPEQQFFNYDNLALVPCNFVLNLSEMKEHNDWVNGSKVLVQYLCVDKKFL